MQELKELRNDIKHFKRNQSNGDQNDAEILMTVEVSKNGEIELTQSQANILNRVDTTDFIAVRSSKLFRLSSFIMVIIFYFLSHFFVLGF